MKGYQTAFDICEEINKDQKVIDNNYLIYPGGWREDFFTIIIKRFDNYDDDVKYALNLIKEALKDNEEWTYIKDFYDGNENFVEIQYQML